MMAVWLEIREVIELEFEDGAVLYFVLGDGGLIAFFSSERVVLFIIA